MDKKAFFIATGSELLNFKSNLYTPIFSQKLSELGIELIGEITSQDNQKSIENAISFALKQADILISCGGIGPTFDDLTRQAFSKVLGLKLIHSKKIEQFLKKRYKFEKLPPNMLNQCLALSGAKLIENFNGTAFGEIIKCKNKVVIILPGPKSEWEPMWENKIKSFFKNKAKSKKIYMTRFKIADLKEMEVQNLLMPVMQKYEDINYTVLAGPNICEFIIKTKDNNTFTKAKNEIKNIFGKKIYGYGNETLEENLGKVLKAKRLTLATAESCTSGLTANLITNISGSSKYFKGGINAYSNEIKQRILKVKKGTLIKYGAVSQQCAKEMAENIRKIFRTDMALSITGIAGPTGETKEKPVGLVWFGIADKNRVQTFSKFFKGSRKFIKSSAANTALYYALLKAKTI